MSFVRKIPLLHYLFEGGYGRCARCNVSWRWEGEGVTVHDTWFDVNEFGGKDGCFCLCQQCWDELGTADARLPYYEQLFRYMGEDDEAEWALVVIAVKAESGETQPFKDPNV